MTSPKLSRYFSDAEYQGRGYVNPAHPERRPVPGVTSITKLVHKDMAQYGANMTAKWITENWDIWGVDRRSDESAYNYARYRHNEYRDERAEVGTGVHAFIEEWIEGKDPVIDFLEPEQQQMIEQFHEAVFMTGMEFQSTEATVFGGDWAGTLDAHATASSERLGRVATGVVDFKTSKTIYPETSMQLAALKSAGTIFVEVSEGTEGAYHLPDKKRGDSWWLVQDAPKVETAWILHLRGDFWDGKQLVPAKWELIELQDEELHMKRFEAYKTVWYSEKALKDAGVDLKARLSK